MMDTQMNPNFHAKQKGFTIIELLVVIVVIGILASIAIVGYGAYKTRANAKQYGTDALAISKKAETMASEGIGSNAYPTTTANFPTTASSNVLPAGTGVTYTSAATTAITNTSVSASSDPAVSSSTTAALTINSSSNKRVYTVKSCSSGAGFIIFYPDPENSSTANAAVKSLKSGDTTSC